ncbi:MAG TPA: dihydroneopterin aldolase [Candidatus Dormibacteraeota bacterium]
MDRLLLQGMAFSGKHGVLPGERELPRRFTVDVELHSDLRRAGSSDHLADTVDYTRAYEVVRRVMEGESRQLLESLAESIAGELLALDGVESARVRVAKTPPLAGEFRSFAVEIERSRSD